MHEWYPQNKEELNKILEEFLKNVKAQKEAKEIHGLIVPHAGYIYSGAIAGKAFGLLKNKIKNIRKAVVIGPSHYAGFYGIRVIHKDRLNTPLGKIKVAINNFKEIHVPEHSVLNQIPFLQKIDKKISILPLVVGQIDNEDAEKIAENLSKEKNAVFIFSTDLSHFLPYKEAVSSDKNTIKIIEELNFKKFSEIDACGSYALLIAMHLCRIKNFKPKLIEYKNSGDVTGFKEQGVVGYASFYF